MVRWRQCPTCGASLAPDPSAWLSVADFCKKNQISRSTAARWRARGLIEEQRIDGKVRVREVDDRARWPLT